MAASQACAALIGLLSLWPSLAVPTCKANQFQVSDIVFNCEGSAGSVDINQIKVNVPTLSEIVVATIPKGVPDFQAQLRGQHDADLFIKDRSTGESIYSVLPGGASGLGSSSRSGVYGSLSIHVTQSVGLPTVESVTCSGHSDTTLELVVRNNGNEGMVDLGFFYGPWTPSSGSCLKMQPHGCLPYNQNAVEKSGMAFSSWLSTAYGTCDQAWTQIGVPETAVDGGALGVPYYNWGNVYRNWPSESRPDVGLPHMELAMFKFVSNGGLEDNKNVVRRSDFTWICGLKQMSDQWMQPCCAKLRTAFTDESDAWSKLGQIAETNGHRDPLQAVWEVCRSLPHAPLGGRVDLLHLLNSDSRHVPGPSDIKFCWPHGPVEVHPTSKPLVEPYIQHISQPSPASAPGGMQPWENDGSGRPLGHTPTPAPPAQTTQPATPANPNSNKATIAPVMASGTTPKPGLMSGTTRPLKKGSTTPYPIITDPPATTPRSGLDIAKHTSEYPRGVTMAPAEIGDDAPITTSGAHWQGIAIATGVGFGVAGAAIGTAAGIHASITSKNNQGRNAMLGTPGGVYARRGSMPMGRIVGGNAATTEPGGTGQGVFPVLLLLGVFCGFLLCVGVVGFLLYCINRKRQQTMDREMYMPHQGMGFYPPDSEDQENLLQHNPFQHPMYPQPQAMYAASLSRLQ